MNSLSSGANEKFKQFLAIALTLATTVVLSGLAALMPVISANAASDLSEGSLIKTADAPEVYIINDKAHGSYAGWKRHIFNPEVFNMYGHLNWSDIKIVPQSTVDAYETSDLYKADVDPRVYSLEEQGSSAVKHHIASVEAFNSRGYSWDQIFTVNEREVNYYATGSVYGVVTTTPTPPVVAEVSVSLASDNPASGTLIAGQSIADLAHFTLTNSTATDAKVTKVTLNRIGVSADTTLSNVYLFDGISRLTDSATVSSGVITFVNSAGILTVPANSSVTITVKSDIATGTSGQTVGVALAGVASDAAISGTFPVSGNLHTVATATLASVSFNTTTTPATNTSLQPQDDFIMWKNTVAIGTRSAMLKSFRLRMIGSVQTADLANFELFVDGVKVGNTVAQLDANGYVTFDLSTSPIELKTGNRTIKMVGDVVGGSSRNFLFSLRQTADVDVVDKDYGANILAQANSTTFSARSSGTQSISSGTLTITKTSDSPSGDVTLNATGVTLAKFELKAAGESMKIENLYATVTNDGSASTTMTLRNGALFANGVQVGSTASLEGAAAGTKYSFGSSLIVNPGSPVTLEVRADVFDDDGINGLVANETLQVSLVVGSSNVQQVSSLGYISSAAATANTVTVVSGSMSLAKYTAYAGQTVVVPQTAYKIGEFRLTADDTEDVTLNTITLTLNNNGTGFSATSTDITNLYVVYGPDTTSVKASGANSQSWSISKTLSANTTINVAVYADLSSDITSGESVIPSLTFAGTTVSSGQSVTAGATVGQTMTIGTGTFAVAADASKPAIALNVANNTVKVGAFKFTSTNQNYTIDQLGASVASGSQNVIQNVIFKDTSGKTLATQPFNGFYATTSTGIGFSVPANQDKVVDVYLQLADVGVGAATTDLNVKVTLNSYKVSDGTGSSTTAYPAVSGNAQYVVKTVPTVTADVSTGLQVGSGTQTIGKFIVSADTNGTVAWKEILFNYSTSTALTLSSIALYEGTTLVPTDTATIQYATSTIRVVPTSAQEIGAGGSKTYSLKATVGGTIDSSAYVQTSISNRSTSHSNAAAYTSGLAGAGGSFIWSDKSASSHSLTTTDWFNDYKVVGIPTDSYSLD